MKMMQMMIMMVLLVNEFLFIISLVSHHFILDEDENKYKGTDIFLFFITRVFKL